jgi:hypothetical protein
MRFRPAAAAAAGAGLLFACSSSPPPQAATGEETLAILAPLMPRDPNDQSCVSEELKPPLEDQRRFGEVVRLSWVERLKSVFVSQPSGRPNDWHQPDPKGGELRLQIKDAKHLEDLLNRAIHADFGSEKIRLTLPTGVRPCRDLDTKVASSGATPRIAFYFSRPVVIGNIAFVEQSGVCGNLCGSGDLVSLIKRNGKWTLLARRMTWIA